MHLFLYHPVYLTRTLETARAPQGCKVGEENRLRVFLARFHRAPRNIERKGEGASGWSLINLFLCILEYDRATA